VSVPLVTENESEIPMSREEISLDAEERMESSVRVLQDNLSGIRTGRASPGLVDSLRVEFYGSHTPIKQLANVAAPEGQLIVIRPFDPGALPAIEKAIQASDLGMVPNNDGRVIRLNVPPLSTERRKKLVSRLKVLSEEARVAIRNVRRDANKRTDQLQKEKVLTEDDRDRVKEEIQELTNQYESEVNRLLDEKEHEMLDQ
tara:strand:+ start:66 stop:668 length:603 start_codon:yes stop_codon:yes gene_type:complete